MSDAEPTDDRLRLLIERIERLEEEKKGIADDIKDVYAEAKAVGYDVKIMRHMEFFVSLTDIKKELKKFDQIHFPGALMTVNGGMMFAEMEVECVSEAGIQQLLEFIPIYKQKTNQTFILTHLRIYGSD